MFEPVLSTRQLNRALLARQLLLDRADLSIPQVLEQVGGLQAQYAPSGYVGLWARLSAFRREQLTEALAERRVAQATLMRSTIHLVSARDFWLFAAGTRDARRDWGMRVARPQLGGLDMDRVAGRVHDLLHGQPRRHADVLQLLAAEGIPRIGWVGAGHFLDLVRVPPAGTWERRRADVYGLAEEWLDRPESTATREDGLVHLVIRYLGGFGPAPLVDIASWAGVPAATLRPIVERLDLRRYRDARGTELLDVPGGPLPDPETPAPVRFLPTWDATLLAHARRTAILPQSYRPLVFNTKTPHSVPTILVDGAVAGTWRFEGGRLDIRTFEGLSATARRELDVEAERLAAFHAE